MQPTSSTYTSQAEDTGRASARALGVRVLCRNPHSKSQRTPHPAPPPAQSRRRKASGRKGRYAPPGSSSSRSRGPPPRNRDRPPGRPAIPLSRLAVRRHPRYNL